MTVDLIPGAAVRPRAILDIEQFEAAGQLLEQKAVAAVARAHRRVGHRRAEPGRAGERASSGVDSGVS